MRCGFSAREAEAAVRWVLEHCPQNQDPREWVPGPELFANDADITMEEIEEAKENWRADKDMPGRWAMILDAMELPED